MEELSSYFNKDYFNDFLNRIDIHSLIDKYKTPFYLYDGNIIRERYFQLFEFIKWPKLKIYYAMKANYNKGILNILNEIGASLDTVSPGEVMLAQRLGFSSERIIFTANNITDDEMHLVREMNVLFNIGSLSRLEKYGKAYPGTKICLRFNTDVVAGEHAKVQTGGVLTKFGILMEDAEKAACVVQRYSLRVVGLHVHTGSGIAEEDNVYQSMRNLLRVANSGHFPDLDFIDLGGGFKIPYSQEERVINYRNFGEKITTIFQEACEQYGRELSVYFEPGKYLVSESGFLFVQVNTIKHNRGRSIAGVNSGFPHLIRPVLYDAHHHIVNISNPEGKNMVYDICGNICETGDCFATDRKVGKINEGDYLAIFNAGAYCQAMASIYNLRSIPTELVFFEDNVTLVRKGLSHSELVDKILVESE